jgi:acetyl-CoA carboxylase carboxyl transferase subunit beta
MNDLECRNCKKKISEEKFMSNLWICPFCGYHSYVSARDRIQITTDDNSFVELGSNIHSVDFLNFYDIKPYSTKLKEAKLKSSLEDAIMVGKAKIKNYSIALGVMDFSFIGGSMGSAIGEKIKIITDYSIEKKVPLVIFCASGGARMQEGAMSLMQMAKTVSCINRIRENKTPYFCIVTNPTSGGVSASFATIADIIISEPGALFCFAGPRVVRQTIKKGVPSDFGTSERGLKNGQVDIIVSRNGIRDTIAKLLKLFER